MSDKCFCHLNGYKVKDVDGRKAENIMVPETDSYIPIGGPLDRVLEGFANRFANFDSYKQTVDEHFAKLGSVKAFTTDAIAPENVEAQTNAFFDSLIDEVSEASSIQVYVNANGLMMYGRMMVLPYGCVIVSGMTFDGNTVMKQKRYDEWTPWLYENPRMINNVEYATTERHDDKIVYVKLINLGEMPTITIEGTHQHKISGLGTVVDINGVVWNGNDTYPILTYSLVDNVYVDKTYVHFRSKGTPEQTYACVKLKYTKE